MCIAWKYSLYNEFKECIKIVNQLLMLLSSLTLYGQQVLPCCEPVHCYDGGGLGKVCRVP